MSGAALAALPPCNRCGAEVEHGDLRCPVCALSLTHETAPTDQVQVRIVRCDQCGASLTWDSKVAAPKCAFCASVMHLETQTDPVEQTEWYLPFTVSPHDAREALGRFLGQKKFFRPSDLATAATLDSLKAIWWPAWIFNARALVSWTADSDAGAARAAWAPHAGQTHMQFRNIAVSASRGLTRKECDALLPRYSLSSADREPKGPKDAHVERFDVTRSGARRLIHDAVQGEASAHVAEVKIPGSTHRNVHVSVLLEGLDTDRYSLPAYVLAYRYGGEVYRVVVHGQDVTQLLGSAPTSVWKVLLAVLGATAAVALLIALFALLSS